MLFKARIKPYNAKSGHTTRRYGTGKQRFDIDRGWYNVSEGLAAKLRLKMNYGVRIFDVCTPEEAIAMEKAEAEAAIEKRDAKQPQRVLMTVEERKERNELLKLRAEKNAREEARRVLDAQGGMSLSDLIARYDTLSVERILEIVADYSVADLNVIGSLEHGREDRGELLGPISSRIAGLEAPPSVGEPFDGYDGMNVPNVLEALHGATTAEIQAVIEYESAQTKPRSTLLGELEAQLG